MNALLSPLMTLALFLLPLVAQAQGDRTGGGGDIIACMEDVPNRTGFFNRLLHRDRKLRYYLLDVYEAKQIENRLLNLGGQNLSIDEKIQLIVDDFAKFDPVRAKRYGDEAKRIWRDLEPQEHGDAGGGYAALLNQRIPDIDDSDDVFDFRGCTKYQLVRQEPPIIRGAYYTFDKRWWGRLNRDNKVATIFHEVVYREFREYGAEVSRPSRKLNSFLFSRTTNTLTIAEYLSFLSSNGAKTFYFNTNVGLVRLNNLVDRRNVWSAFLSTDGSVTDVTTQNSEVDLAKAGFGKLPAASVKSLMFNRERQLTGFKGQFSVSYDPVSKKILSYDADCTLSQDPCIESTLIEVTPNTNQMRIAGPEGIVAFDGIGNVLKQ